MDQTRPIEVLMSTKDRMPRKCSHCIEQLDNQPSAPDHRRSADLNGDTMPVLSSLD
jgi:hypothetical protein